MPSRQTIASRPGSAGPVGVRRRAGPAQRRGPRRALRPRRVGAQAIDGVHAISSQVELGGGLRAQVLQPDRAVAQHGLRPHAVAQQSLRDHVAVQAGAPQAR